MCRSDCSGPSFLSLPGEVRNQIYSYLFDDQVLKLDYKPKTKQENGKPRLRTLRFGLDLLLTCRFIEQELDGFIFDRCTFSFHSDQALWKFVGMVSDTNLARIRKLHLDMVLFDVRDMFKWDEVFNRVVLKKLSGLQYVSVDIQLANLSRVDEAAVLRQCTGFAMPLVAIKKGIVRLYASVSFLPR